MARLAFDAITDLKLRATLSLWNVVGVTVETAVRCLRGGDAQLRGNLFRLRCEKGLVSACVTVLCRPDAIFVQPDILVLLLRQFSVADSGCATRYAKMDVDILFGCAGERCKYQHRV